MESGTTFGDIILGYQHLFNLRFTDANPLWVKFYNLNQFRYFPLTMLQDPSTDHTSSAYQFQIFFFVEKIVIVELIEKSDKIIVRNLFISSNPNQYHISYLIVLLSFNGRQLRICLICLMSIGCWFFGSFC